jgi:hypothetical protein
MQLLALSLIVQVRGQWAEIEATAFIPIELVSAARSAAAYTPVRASVPRLPR